ncbi:MULTISPECIES: hypothetical protein [unclassified Streptomyces]|uniref:hypothetical protein n=1 Tax=unclassified Streptomyces TaxID=2593676 RepID=UPI00100837E7|nr:hypothetical protein [Streptomyces sp. S063]
MSDDVWTAITSRETVLVLAALSVYLGGTVGLARSLPRLLRRNAGWRRGTERDPVPSTVVLALIVVLWPVSVVYLGWRVALRLHANRARR